jgi:hypothetical protein
MSRQSTPGQHGRLYLQAHRDSQLTNLPAEHRQAREDIMSQLERKDQGIRERALTGSNRHFDQPLTPGEREHQRNWQQQEGLDHGQVLDRRRALDQPATARGQRASSRGRRRPSMTRRGPSTTRRAIEHNPVGEGAAGAAGLFWELITAGVALSILFLLLSKTGSTAYSSVLNGLTGALGRLADPHNDLFTPSAPQKAPSAPQKAPSVKRANARPPASAGVFGPALPSYATLTPTIP